MQRKNWSEYEKAQKQAATRTLAICAAVAAIHVVIMVFSFLTWHGEGHRLALLVPVQDHSGCCGRATRQIA